MRCLIGSILCLGLTACGGGSSTAPTKPDPVTVTPTIAPVESDCGSGLLLSRHRYVSDSIAAEWQDSTNSWEALTVSLLTDYYSTGGGQTISSNDPTCLQVATVFGGLGYDTWDSDTGPVGYEPGVQFMYAPEFTLTAAPASFTSLQQWKDNGSPAQERSSVISGELFVWYAKGSTRSSDQVDKKTTFTLECPKDTLIVEYFTNTQKSSYSDTMCELNTDTNYFTCLRTRAVLDDNLFCQLENIPAQIPNNKNVFTPIKMSGSIDKQGDEIKSYITNIDLP
ncbi:hypothetical protein [Motilimonas cestriensis]|uniref:hypothetical protein n=1 Tax=Motilimonas cestriensis TaxID=2742685 RepID=UPI003DA53147